MKRSVKEQIRNCQRRWKNSFCNCLVFLVEVTEGEDKPVGFSLPFWNNYCYNYLDDTEIFCYSWTSILRKFPRLFITHPAMDTTTTTVDPKFVLEPKISCNINTPKKYDAQICNSSVTHRILVAIFFKLINGTKISNSIMLWIKLNCPLYWSLFDN